MLRITSQPAAPGNLCLRLEGRLIGPWVAELQTAIYQPDTNAQRVELDLAAVSFVDDEGLALLQSLLSQGVALRRVTPFIQELLRTRPVL